MCNAAITICPAPDEVAHWVWRRTRNTVTGAATPWVRDREPPYTCVGPDDPVVTIPPEVLVQAIVRREFRTYGLASGRTEVEPTGRTLVNIPTRFSTATGSYDLPVRTLLGLAVQVRADAVRYDWDFIDGTGLTDGGPGQRGTDQVAHTYDSAGQVEALVDVTWRGSFHIAGIAQTYTIDELVTIEGELVPLTVLTARSELVSQ